MFKARYAVTRKSDERYLIFQNLGDVAAMWVRDSATTFEDKSEADKLAELINQLDKDYCYVQSVMPANYLAEIMGCQPGDLN